MGCNSSTDVVQVEPIRRHTTQSLQQEHLAPPARAFPRQHSGEASLPPSYETWRWSHIPLGVPGPPERKMHEKHIGKLNLWLSEIENQPVKLFAATGQQEEVDGADLDQFSV
eukprot:Skav224767  [mRNA]  locus=scaffold1604:524422:531147:+ [translate_table: standard]